MSDAPQYLLEIDGVSKRFGATLAVERVSFGIRAGEIVGFLGPNGAGKSTLLRMVSTYLAPDSGRISVAGHDVVRQSLAARRSLGYLTEHNALYEGMRVERYLAFIGAARGMTAGRLRQRLGWTVEACALAPVLHKRVQECSKGFRQRIGLAAALIHDPAVIALDEPTHGLDPLQMVAFRQFLGSLAPGRAILFSSHIVSEVSEISSRVVVIQRGRLVADRTIAVLHEAAAGAGCSVEQHLVTLLSASAAEEVQ